MALVKTPPAFATLKTQILKPRTYFPLEFSSQKATLFAFGVDPKPLAIKKAHQVTNSFPSREHQRSAVSILLELLPSLRREWMSPEALGQKDANPTQRGPQIASAVGWMFPLTKPLGFLGTRYFWPAKSCCYIGFSGPWLIVCSCQTANFGKKGTFFWKARHSKHSRENIVAKSNKWN